jgi:hypothetical protein
MIAEQGDETRSTKIENEAPGLVRGGSRVGYTLGNAEISEIGENAAAVV